MKKVLIVLASICIAFNINAQKVKKDRVSVQYLQLPSSPLDESIKTYNVKSTINWSGMASSNRATITGIELKGLKKELYDKGDIEIELLVEPYFYEIENSSKTKTSTKDGVKVETTTYTATIKHKYPVRVMMTNLKTGERFEDYYVGSSLAKGPYATSTSSKWDARSAAAKKATTAKQSLFNSNIKSAENIINSSYGFAKKTGTYTLNYIKSKKYDYPEADEALSKAKSAFSQNYKATAEVDPNFRAKMEEAIASWEKLVNEYDPDTKKARMDKKNTKEIYENIYLGYFFLNDWANCDQTLRNCENNFKKAGWDYYWKKSKEDKQQRYEANNK